MGAGHDNDVKPTLDRAVTIIRLNFAVAATASSKVFGFQSSLPGPGLSFAGATFFEVLFFAVEVLFFAAMSAPYT